MFDDDDDSKDHLENVEQKISWLKIHLVNNKNFYWWNEDLCLVKSPLNVCYGWIKKVFEFSELEYLLLFWAKKCILARVCYSLTKCCCKIKEDEEVKRWRCR